MSEKVNFWTKVGNAIVHLLHWCTGWIVHPDKGGCCTYKKDDEK